MSFKTIILVVLVSFFIGAIIFLLTFNKKFHVEQIVKLNPLTLNRSKNISPTPTPKPTAASIKEGANLEEEVNKLTPEDFSEDFNNLKEFMDK